MAELVSMRKAYGESLVELGKKFPEVVVLSADVSNSDHSYMFEEVFPERFINVGIAEQALVDVAVGLAYCQKIPFVNTFAFLFATRALEMVRTHLCYGKANVKLMAAYAGLSDSFDGPTHHSVTDVAIMRSLPHMTVVVPGDPIALAKLLPQVAEWEGPVYFRLNRNEVPVLFEDSYDPHIGDGIVLRPGKDVTIICNGLMVSRSLEAAQNLSDKGVDARVLEIHTVKPIDREIILKAANETGALITVEEHSVIGGLGGAVAEVVTEEVGVTIQRVGIPDRFAETGPYESLLDRYGMSVDHIVNATLKAVEKKKGIKL
jgi:transketolase